MIKWLERHLNWAWLIGILAVLPASVILGFIIGVIFYQSPEDTIGQIAETSGRVFGLVWYLVVSGLVIWRKNRSLAWILLSGWLSPVWLPNKRKGAV